MKLNIRIPRLQELQKLLQADPLRDLRERQKVLELSALEFTSDLCKRVECSRFEPRIFESCIERIALFPTSLDGNQMLKHASNFCWPRIWPLAFSFSDLLLNQKESLWTSVLKDFINRQHPAASALESFYIALQNPVSQRTQKIIASNGEIWEAFGYWAQDLPFSKELLQYFQMTSPDQKISKRAYDEVFIGFMHEKKNQWLSLNEICEKTHSPYSKRQMLRFLNLKGIKKSGTHKGTRYRFVA